MLFNKENIYLDFEASNYTELFKKMSNIFLEKNYIKEGYLESLLEREKNYPTGLNFEAYSVAIPHTDPSFIEQEKIVVVRLKENINFTEMGTNDNQLSVKLIFMLLINKGDKQVNVLLNLMNLLSNKNTYESIEKANNIDEIYNILIKEEL